MGAERSYGPLTTERSAGRENDLGPQRKRRLPPAHPGEAMKPALLLALPALAISLAVAADRTDEPTADEKAVRRAIADYCEAFYEAKPELIERSVSKNLKKMGYWKGPDREDYSEAQHMTFEQAIELAKRWNAEDQREDLRYSIELHEVADKTAAAKLTADWGIDYMHLAKEGDKWMIHHVLWQSHPPQD